MDCGDRVGNLQLLDGVINNEKRAKLPAEWLKAHFRDRQGRKHYQRQHLMGNVPKKVTEFLQFYNARRARLRERIASLVGQA